MIANISAQGGSWRRLAALGAVAIGLLSFLGWQAGETAVPMMRTPAPASWTLPKPLVEDPDKDLALLTARRPWSNGFGGGAAEAGKEQKAELWRLAGIIERPDGKFVLLAMGQPPATKIEYRQIGDKLPDGSTLVDITLDNAVVKTADGERQVRPLFGGPPK